MWSIKFIVTKPAHSDKYIEYYPVGRRTRIGRIRHNEENKNEKMRPLTSFNFLSETMFLSFSLFIPKIEEKN